MVKKSRIFFVYGIVISIIFIVIFFTFLLYLIFSVNLNNQLKLVKEYYSVDDLETARSLMEKVVVDHSNNKRVLLLYKEIIEKYNKKREEEKLADQAKREEANRVLMRMLYELLNSVRGAKDEKSDKMVRGWALNPELDFLIEEGVRLFESGKYAIAKVKLKSAVMIDEENPYANAYLGALLFFENPENENNIKEAVVRSNKALRINSKIEISHYTLGLIYMKKGLIEEAIGEFTDTIRLNPLNYKASFDLGKIYFTRGDFENALKFFNLTVESKRDFADGYFYLGEIEYKRGNYERALLYYVKAITNDELYNRGYLRIGEIHRLRGDIDKAILNYEIINRVKKSYRISYELGVCFKEKGDVRRGIESFNESISLNPGLNEEERGYKRKSYEFLIELYEKVGEKKKKEEVMRFLEKI